MGGRGGRRVEADAALSLVFAVGDGLVQPEALNKKAIQIINRVRDKLTGEFLAEECRVQYSLTHLCVCPVCDVTKGACCHPWSDNTNDKALAPYYEPAPDSL